MRSLILIMALFSGLLCDAQSTTHRTKKIKDGGEVYYVRKSDEQIKEGFYSKQFGPNYIEGQYVNNERSGRWTIKIDRYKATGEFNEDKRNGLWEFRENSVAFARVYYSMGKVDSCFGYHEDGTIQSINILDPTVPGFLRSFYQNGQLSSEVHRKNGEPHGVASFYFDNGQLYRKLTYENGKLLTTSSVFAPNGREIESGDLQDGNGSYFAYNFSAEGKFYKSVEVNYKDSVRHGIYKSYESNGKIEQMGKYEHGNQAGPWVRYKNGIGTDTISYEGKGNNVILSSIESNLEVQRMPGFPGGEVGMYKFLGRTIRYPVEARERGISGRVYVQFTVFPNGAPGDFKVVRSPLEDFSKEVLRVMNEMPDWVPGFSYGRPVPVQYTIPVEFRLN